MRARVRGTRPPRHDSRLYHMKIHSTVSNATEDSIEYSYGTTLPTPESRRDLNMMSDALAFTKSARICPPSTSLQIMLLLCILSSRPILLPPVQALNWQSRHRSCTSATTRSPQSCSLSSFQRSCMTQLVSRPQLVSRCKHLPKRHSQETHKQEQRSQDTEYFQRPILRQPCVHEVSGNHHQR